MGIHKVTAYVIQCDKCKIFYPGPDGQGCIFFNTREKVEQEEDFAIHWHKKDGKTVCPSCVEQI